MTIAWEIVTENMLNFADIVNDFVDNVNEKDIEWVVINENGDSTTKTFPNVAKIISTVKQSYVDTYKDMFVFKTDGDTLDSWKTNLVDTTNNRVTLHLPNDVDDRTIVIVADGTYNASNYNIVIDVVDDSKINNDNTEVSITSNGGKLMFIYNSSLNKWFTIS